jgi:Relaxase/Mobilisation nuclease domain
VIVKHIDNKRGDNSFKRLAAYVTGERNGGRGDPTIWQLADYITDKDHAGEKVAAIRVTNCISQDPGWAVKECCVLASQNRRSRKDKAYHLVVSFPEGERPTPEQMIDIEDEIVRSIGFRDHKRISAIHQNTDNWHLHVAICTVHPVTLRNVTPFYDHFRLQEVCQELELKHGLIRDNHSRDPERPLNGKSGEIKAHAERVAFARWVEEHAGEAIREAAASAKTWAELHAALAPYGVVIKPRGAGLVIAHHANDKIRIKASEVSRGMSMKALTDRFGAYEAPAEIVQARKEYVSQVPEPTPATERLWDRYKTEQTTALLARTIAMSELRDKHAAEYTKLSEWYEWRHDNLRAQHLIRANRLQSLRYLAERKGHDRAELRTKQLAEREAMRAKYQTPSWSDYVSAEAGRGNREALSVVEQLMRQEGRESAIERLVTRDTGLGR